MGNNRSVAHYHAIIMLLGVIFMDNFSRVKNVFPRCVLCGHKDLERKRSEKRQMFFEAQDAVDEKKEKLLSEIEKMLAQHLHQEELFTIKWTIK